MSALKVNTKILSFADRLQLVGDEVNRRLSASKPKHRDALKARLWVRWLKRELDKEIREREGGVTEEEKERLSPSGPKKEIASYF